MTQEWKYKAVVIVTRAGDEEEASAELNKWAEAGWELFDTVRYPDGYCFWAIFRMKKEAQP